MTFKNEIKDLYYDTNVQKEIASLLYSSAKHFLHWLHVESNGLWQQKWLSGEVGRDSSGQLALRKKASWLARAY